MLAYFLQGFALGLSAAATPGPFQAYILAQAAQRGWQRSWGMAFAPLLSDGPIIALVLLVLTQTPPWFLNGLQIVGGFFIVYLAWGAFQAYRTYQPLTEPPSGATDQRNFLQATVMNLLNPNPYIFWTVIGGPILLKAWKNTPWQAGAFLVGIYLTLIGGFILLIFLFSAAGQLGPRVTRILVGVSAVALALFGVYELWQGVIHVLAPA